LIFYYVYFTPVRGLVTGANGSGTTSGYTGAGTSIGCSVPGKLGNKLLFGYVSSQSKNPTGIPDPPHFLHSSILLP